MPRCFLAAKLKYPYIKWKEGQEDGGGDRTNEDAPMAAWQLGLQGCPLALRRQEEQEEKEEEEGKEEEEEQEMMWWKGDGIRTEGSLKSMRAPLLVLM